MTQISRRAFFSTAILAWLDINRALATPAGIYVNGHIDQLGQHHISGFDASGQQTFQRPLPNKAHGFAVNPIRSHHLVAVPTLPGTLAPVFNVNNGQQIALIKSRAGRHFYGHACFSPDGNELFISENIIDNAEGMISVYDGRDYTYQREFPLHGIGPHDIRMLPDGKTLVVALGGIRTHPESNKRELNINNMRSALLLINSQNGQIIARHDSPTNKLSIRHLDVSIDGTVLITCQYKGRKEMPPLVAIQRGNGGIEMLSINDEDLWPLQNYTASARIAANGIAAVSCPRGNLLTIWDLVNKKFLKSIAINDVGGLALSPTGNAFIASANVGELLHIDASTLNVTQLSNNWKDAKWTNHMASL